MILGSCAYGLIRTKKPALIKEFVERATKGLLCYQLLNCDRPPLPRAVFPLLLAREIVPMTGTYQYRLRTRYNTLH
jgi:hypothetical protein